VVWNGGSEAAVVVGAVALTIALDVKEVCAVPVCLWYFRPSSSPSGVVLTLPCKPASKADVTRYDSMTRTGTTSNACEIGCGSSRFAVLNHWVTVRGLARP
jgi:hypothetical protein